MSAQKIISLLKQHLVKVTSMIAIIAVTLLIFQNFILKNDQNIVLNNKLASLTASEDSLKKQLETIETEFTELKNEDQVKTNQDLKKELTDINRVYKLAVTSYEKLVDLKLKLRNTDKQDKLLAESLSLLASRKYTEAEAKITELDKTIKEETDKQAAATAQTVNTQAKITETTPANNTPPSSGYSRQKVQTDVGAFTVDIISADLGSTKVVVDTASDSDCRDNCPALALADFVSRSGAYAGINGPYFCPASYPSCAGKTNTFDTLLMNKNKTYFNSDNNVYSTIPAVIFSGSSVRYVNQTLEWGRDTSPDAVIANYPLLIINGNVVYGGSSDGKLLNKGGRSFIGSTGSTVYIGVVYSATVAESTQVLKTMGIQNALNLDNGGSTALWSGGYKTGPGRALPFAILLVRR